MKSAETVAFPRSDVVGGHALDRGRGLETCLAMTR
jgi:hypothetical protein